MLKLGSAIYTYIWKYSLHGAIERIAELGFSAIEIMTIAPQLDPRTFTQEDRKNLVKHCEHLGVEIVSLNPTFIDLNLASRIDTIRQESINEIKFNIDLAADIGAKIIVIGPGRRHPLVLEPLELSHSLADPAIIECVKYAEKKDIIYGFENITSRFMVKPDEIIEFIDKVGSNNLKSVLDVANAFYYADPVEYIHKLGDRICHVHLSDTDGKVEAHWPIGLGKVNFASISKALQEINYKGWSFLETTWMEDPDWGITSSIPVLESLGWMQVKPVPIGV